MKKINVSLHGVGKNTKQTRMVISCDKYSECGFYKRNQCLRCNAFNSYCIYGNTQRITGYTPRAKKHYDFKHVTVNDECYSKLSYVSEKITKVGDYLYLPLPYLENYVNSLDFIEHKHFIMINDFNLEIVKKIVDFQPRAMFGGVIESYQTENIPKFVNQLKEEYPDLFNELINSDEKYSKYKNLSNIGRKAYVKTLKIGCEIIEKSSKWTWDGSQLASNAYKPIFTPFGATNIQTIIIPEDNTTVEITDDNQVDSSTKYVD